MLVNYDCNLENKTSKYYVGTFNYLLAFFLKQDESSFSIKFPGIFNLFLRVHNIHFSESHT